LPCLSIPRECTGAGSGRVERLVLRFTDR